MSKYYSTFYKVFKYAIIKMRKNINTGNDIIFVYNNINTLSG